MPKRAIVIAPEPELKETAEPVAVVDDRVRRLMDDMLDSMHAANGIGLAAPQVGVAERVIVVDVTRPDEPSDPYRMVNPELLWHSDEQVTAEEGCLSLPDQYAEVTRPARVRVRYLDETGTERELEAGGLLARCVQHEMDHLDGVLFVDHLSALKRDIILRKLRKMKRELEAAHA